MSCQLQITIFGPLYFTGQGAGRDLSQPEWLLVDAPPDCVWHQRGHLPGVRQECKAGGQHVHNWHRTQACTQELPACHITLHNQVNCISYWESALIKPTSESGSLPTLRSGVRPTPLWQDYYDPSIAFRSPPLGLHWMETISRRQ